MGAENTPIARGLPVRLDMSGYFAKIRTRKRKSAHKTLHPVKRRLQKARIISKGDLTRRRNCRIRAQ